MKNYYRILEISHSACSSTIKQAYRKLAKQWHPDLHENSETAHHWFKEITEAYEILSNGNKKVAYDFKLRKAIVTKRVVTIHKPIVKTAKKEQNSLEDYQQRIEQLMQQHQKLLHKNKKMAEYYRNKEQKAKTFYDTFRENREQAYQAMKNNLHQVKKKKIL
ncbi:MAG: DnaJ domain-containing protein [Thermonemataceae bacterium]